MSTSEMTPVSLMAYMYRLEGYDEEWRPAYEGRVEYRDLPLGTYTLQVKAVDRDLNYAAPDERSLEVVPDPRDQRIDELEQRIGERTRELEEANRQLEEQNRELEGTNDELQQKTADLEDANRRLEEFNTVLADANYEIQDANQRLEEFNTVLADANYEIQMATQRKSDFLARMSHDLRTPMNAIIGYTRILLRRARDVLGERQYRNLENIETSSNNLLSLINDILDLSRIEAGRVDIKPVDVDIKQLIDDCATSVEPLVKPGVELQRRLDAVPAVHTDAECLRRGVMNLLGNAVKFTEAGAITVSLKTVDGGAEIAVADTGVGIPAADLPHIFDEFQQVERQGSDEKEGTGLGLSIAKKSVELLGGTLAAESEVGKGTAFTLRIADYTRAEPR